MKNLFLNGLTAVMLFFFTQAVAQPQDFYVKITIQTAPSCHGDAGELGSDITGGGTAPFSYKWHNRNSSDIIGTDAVLTGVQIDWYSLQVTDALGHTYSDTISLSQMSASAYSSPAHCPYSDGTAGVEYYGTYASPLTVSWSNGSTGQTITGLAPNETVTVQITDANGCPFTFTEYINEQPIQSTSQTVKVGSVPSFTMDHQYEPATCTRPDGYVIMDVSGTTAPYSYIWNTSPVKTGVEQHGLTSGSYTVHVTDNAGCFGDYSFELPNTSGSLSGYAYATQDEYCQRKNGSVMAYMNGGTPPFSIQWNSGETDVLSLSNLSAGYYSVTIKDAENCQITKGVSLDRFSPLATMLTVTDTDCSNASGTIDAQVTGGTLPYTYYWSNQAVTQDVSGLGIGWYTFYTRDAEGCIAYEYVNVNTQPGCQGNIAGLIYQDNNNNCVKDNDEPVIVNQNVFGSNLTTHYGMCSTTDATGFYALRYPYNGTYSVDTYLSSPYYSGQCSSSGQTLTVTAPNNYTDNIGFIPKAIGPDLQTSIYSSWVRPGFSYTYEVYVRNVGTQALSSGTVEIQLNAIEELMGFSEFPASYDPALHQLIFNLNNLQLNEVQHFSFTCKIAPTVLLNTHFNVSAIAYPLSGDLEENSNSYSLRQTVVGSYDPNDIQSFKSGDLTLEEDTALTYHIRFQNTGTFYAEFVVVRDTLDPKLDPSTLRDIQSSHPVNVTLLPNNVIEFAFTDIFLSDSSSNESGSHGFVNYKINLKKNVIAGDVIPNSAAIYFDYNAPVLTNKVNNRVAVSTRVFNGTNVRRAVLVFPNPAHDHASFTFPEEVQNFELLNAFGQSVYSVKTDQKTVEVNTSNRQGMHYYKATDKKGEVYSGKIVIE